MHKQILSNVSQKPSKRIIENDHLKYVLRMYKYLGSIGLQIIYFTSGKIVTSKTEKPTHHSCYALFQVFTSKINQKLKKNLTGHIVKL